MMQKGDKLVAGTYVADEKTPHFKLCTSNLENTKTNNRFIECYTRTEGEDIRILHQYFAESPKDFANLMEQVGFRILDKRVGSMGMRTAAMFVAEQNQGS